jgi:hypothetical protein
MRGSSPLGCTWVARAPMDEPVEHGLVRDELHDGGSRARIGTLQHPDDTCRVAGVPEGSEAIVPNTRAPNRNHNPSYQAISGASSLGTTGCGDCKESDSRFRVDAEDAIAVRVPIIGRSQHDSRLRFALRPSIKSPGARPARPRAAR